MAQGTRTGSIAGRMAASILSAPFLLVEHHVVVPSLLLSASSFFADQFSLLLEAHHHPQLLIQSIQATDPG